MTTPGSQLNEALARHEAQIQMLRSDLSDVDAKANATAKILAGVGQDYDELDARVSALEAAEPTPGPPIDPTPPPGDEYDAAEINLALALHQGGAFDLPAGTINGGLVVPSNDIDLRGPRTLIKARVGEPGIDITGKNVRFTLDGPHVHGPPDLQRDIPGIRLNLGSQAGRHADISLHNFSVDGFDRLVNLVDSKPRRDEDPLGGRIKFTASRFKLSNAYGSGSHQVGFYIEGASEPWSISDGEITRIGFNDDGTDPRDNLSSGIYAQGYGAPGFVDNVAFDDISFRAIESRRGVFVADSVMSRCPAALYVRDDYRQNGSSSLTNCVILDQRDINDGPNDERSRVVKAWNLGTFQMADNIIARRHGRALNREVVEISGASSRPTNNTIVDYPHNGTTLSVNGEERIGQDGNRYLAADPGVPAYADKRVGETLSEFIDRCQEALA